MNSNREILEALIIRPPSEYRSLARAMDQGLQMEPLLICGENPTITELRDEEQIDIKQG